MECSPAGLFYFIFFIFFFLFYFNFIFFNAWEIFTAFIFSLNAHQSILFVYVVLYIYGIYIYIIYINIYTTILLAAAPPSEIGQVKLGSFPPFPPKGEERYEKLLSSEPIHTYIRVLFVLALRGCKL